MHYLLESELEATRVRTGPVNTVRIETVKESVALVYKVDPTKLTTINRRDRIAMMARQVAMYVCYQVTQKSLTQIARAFGATDHSSVHHARVKVERRMNADPKYRAAIEDLIADIVARTAA